VCVCVCVCVCSTNFVVYVSEGRDRGVESGYELCGFVSGFYGRCAASALSFSGALLRAAQGVVQLVEPRDALRRLLVREARALLPQERRRAAQVGAQPAQRAFAEQAPRVLERARADEGARPLNLAARSLQPPQHSPILCG